MPLSIAALIYIIIASFSGLTRAEANAVYWDRESAVATVPKWGGAVESCYSGSTSRAYRDATVATINAYRRLCGLGEIAADDGLELGCQEAALIMLARRVQTGQWDLTHQPPADWPCWTPLGATGAARSNIAANPGPVAVEQYMDSHPHRGWILFRRALTFGVGSCWLPTDVGGANAIDVFGLVLKDYARDFVAFPPPGFFPRPMMRADWSFALEDADFSVAAASVNVSNAAVGVVQLGPFFYGDPYFAFRPSVILTNPGPDVRVDVTIRRVRVAGVEKDFSYSFTAFWPAEPPNAAREWRGYE